MRDGCKDLKVEKTSIQLGNTSKLLSIDQMLVFISSVSILLVNNGVEACSNRFWLGKIENFKNFCTEIEMC